MAPRCLRIASRSTAGNGHDGGLSGCTELARFERDGKKWARVQANAAEYVVEVEIKPDGGVGDVIALPPERAWEIALDQDKLKRPGMIYD